MSCIEGEICLRVIVADQKPEVKINLSILVEGDYVRRGSKGAKVTDK